MQFYFDEHNCLEIENEFGRHQFYLSEDDKKLLKTLVEYYFD